MRRCQTCSKRCPPEQTAAQLQAARVREGEGEASVPVQAGEGTAAALQQGEGRRRVQVVHRLGGPGGLGCSNQAERVEMPPIPVS